MSLGVCLTDLVEKKQITPECAARMREVYDELLARYEARYGREAAEAMATEQALKAIDDDFLHRKRMTLLQAKAQTRILAESRSRFDGGKRADGPVSGRAMMAHLVRDERAGGIQNLEYRWKNIKQTALGMMYDVLSKHRANLLGEVRNKSDLDDVVRELTGQSTGSANARELADAWRQTGEWLRQSFNAAGGRIGKLEGWALPHRHDGQRVGQVTPDQWIDAIAPRLDRARMIDHSTGEPLSDARLREVLADVYETIVSDGWNTRSPGAISGKAVASRHAEHRVLHFASADDWLAYNEQFGSGTAFDAMMSHIEVMARDIAAMQILGPNPAATIRWMQDMVTKEAATRGGLADRAQAEVDRFQIDRIWQEVTGQNRRAVNRGLALFGSTLRNWQSSTKLGSATLASMSDFGTQALTRRFNGLASTRMIQQYLAQLNPADAADREFIRRAGIIGDEYTGRMALGGRMHLEDAFGGRLATGGRTATDRLESANEISRRLADGVLRASGLNAHTVAGREAMGMEFMASLAQYAPLDFDELNPAWRGFLTRYGIDRAGWDAIRATPMSDYKGARWIKLEDVADRALRDRFFEGMLTEIDFAIPTGGIYTRALVGAARPGTAVGEIIRTGFQFKMFPVTVVAMHGARLMAQSDLSSRARYATAYLGATTLAGAMSYQLSEMAKGKDPRPMTGGDFWWRAILKGGGLGVFGDAIEFSRNEYGQDIGDILKGPTIGTAQTVASLAGAGISEAYALYQDDPELIEKAEKARGKAIRELAAREVPGSSLWYIRAAYERQVVDTVARWAGDDVNEDAKRMQKRAAEQGTSYWLPPGDGGADALAAARAPRVDNALAAAPQ